MAALKDGFGFIETLQHDKEIFFHFSNIEGKGDKLEVRGGNVNIGYWYTKFQPFF